MSGISPEVRQEIAEIFCMLSDTGDIQGYLPGPKLALAASTLDLTLKPTVLSFYKGEKGKSKSSDLNFDTFLWRRASITSIRVTWVFVKPEKCIDGSTC